MGKKKQQEDCETTLIALQEALPLLTVEELKLLYKSIEIQVSMRNLSSYSDDDQESNRQVFDIIVNILSMGGKSRLVIPNSQRNFNSFAFKHPKTLRLLNTQRAKLDNFIHKHYGACGYNDLSRIYALLFKLLIKTMRKEGLSVGIVSVVENMHRLPQILDDAYPGYLQAGLLKLTIKPTTSHKLH